MNHKRPFYKSLWAAVQGIWYCLVQERNMRIHTVAALYVAGFSTFFGLNSTEYAVLFLTFALVLCAEVVNTSIERLCDRDTVGFSQWAKVVKDTAAGAVLVCALFALGVAWNLFWKPEVFPVIWDFFTACWWRLPLLAVSGLLAIAFIIWGPGPLLNKLRPPRRK